MKKILTFIAGTMITGSVLAGGLVTNNNQSAMFTRLQNRNASTEIDAVYFNPAGLTKLGDGFYASINNQTIGQKRTITNNYVNLSGTSPKEYIGKVSAPVYPGVYVAYKTGKLALSAGFNPVGGGGGAKYSTGLPSFEMGISDLVPVIKGTLTPLAALIPTVNNVTAYQADIFFEGKSIYFGYQANVSYAINDMISVAIGGRMVSAKNEYSGYITSVKIETPAAFGGLQAPGDFLRTVAGLVPNPTKTVLTQTAAVIDTKTSVDADAVMKGTGFTPILSVNISPSEKINIALKYEFQTKLNLKTTVNGGKNGGGMFIQDSIAIADMPAILSAGINFSPINKLMLSTSFNYYFDKAVDYDGQKDVVLNKIDKNFIEFGLGAEYGINDKLRISGGWAHTITGVNENYQSDMTYSTNTNSFGAGFGYKINEMIDLNIGGQYTMYAEGSKDFTHMLGTIPITVKETYNKSTWIVGAGLNFSFGK